MNSFMSPEVVAAFVELLVIATALGVAASICCWLIFDIFDRDAP